MVLGAVYLTEAMCSENRCDAQEVGVGGDLPWRHVPWVGADRGLVVDARGGDGILWGGGPLVGARVAGGVR